MGGAAGEEDGEDGDAAEGKLEEGYGRLPARIGGSRAATHDTEAAKQHAS
jgi:hypothetical protein